MMNKKKSISIEKERAVRTYAELWHTSRILLNKGLEQKQGSVHLFRASIVFTAFTLEAYLNHIGPSLFVSWGVLERLGPKDKLDVILEKLGIEPKYGQSPWQVMKNLFEFRNDIAHGKSKMEKETITVPVNKFSEDLIHSWAQSKWEKYCTEKNAQMARRDVSKIIIILHEASGINTEEPFLRGMQFATAKQLK